MTDQTPRSKAARPDAMDQLLAALDALPRPHLWFISDTHFGHARIIELAGRPFGSVTDMDEQIVRDWNDKVAPEDVVIHLGDLALGDLASSLHRTSRLNGRRFLIPGNHDRVSLAYDHGKQIESKLPMYEDAGWTVLPESIALNLGGRAVTLAHYPYSGFGDSHGDERYGHLRPVDLGLPLIHGHVHEALPHEHHGRLMNVSVEVVGYTPVSLTEVSDWLDRISTP